MPSKPRRTRAEKDDLVWEKLDERIDEWVKEVRKPDVYRSVIKLILEHRPGDAVELHALRKGGYNIVYRLEYKDGKSVIMRIPIKDSVPFADEKVRYEVATMKYLKAHTTIPVPEVYHYGMASENTLGLGPFIIMEYIEHERNLSRVLQDPSITPGRRPLLDPNIDEEKLESIYTQVADILLQLDALKFNRIGSLLEDETTGKIDVGGRPLLSNMIDLVVHTDMPEEGIFPKPDTIYKSARDWYAAMADIHLAQLVFQRRDAVENEDDARDKYMARQLFRRAVAENKYLKEDSLTQEFTLYSEDLRPANILVDKNDKIVGVIDWEFAYAAPRSYNSCPPWWLLIEEPESWRLGGIKIWQELYAARLETFLRVMKTVEASRPAVEGELPLSERMRASWESKSWMLNYGARRSWAFDFMWWRHADEYVYGFNRNQDHQARLEMLTPEQRDQMEKFVARKLEEGKSKEIVKLTRGEAVKDLAQYLI